MARIEVLDADGWVRWRDLRLAALADAPDAFGSSLERELAYTEADWRRVCTLGPLFVAVDDQGADVGMAAGGSRPGREEPWVYAMWVAPAARGGGIAGQLLDAVARWARGAGHRRLGLDVTDRAPVARRSYERYGFVANGRTERLERDPGIELAELVLELADLELADPEPAGPELTDPELTDPE